MISSIKNLLRTKKFYIVIFTIYISALLVNSTMIVINNSFLDISCKLIRYVCYLLFLLRFFVKLDIKNRKKIDFNTLFKKHKVIYILLTIYLISVLINLILTGEKEFVILTIVLFSGYDIYPSLISKQLSSIQIILTVCVVFGCVFGLIENFTTVRTTNGIMRNALGFIYTTNISQLVLFSSMIYFFMNIKKIKKIEILYLQLIYLLIYFLTNSRTEFIFSELIIIGCVLYKFNILDYFKKYIIAADRLFILLFPVLPLGSAFLGAFYQNNTFFNLINKLVNNRVAHTSWAFKDYGLPIFGAKTEFIGNSAKDIATYGPFKSNFIDNDYMRVLFQNGLLILICLSIFITITLIILYQKRKCIELNIVMIFLVFGLLNPRVVDLLYSPVCFYVTYTIFTYLKTEKQSIIEFYKNKENYTLRRK